MQLEVAIATLDNILTMSSVEIAELTGKEHKNVLADVRKMLEELELGELSFQRTYLDSNPDMTMTLKEITDILKVRHDNATRTVKTMTKNPKFGACPQTEVMVEIGSGAKRAVLTYVLTKRQSYAVAAKLDTSFMMDLVDRWQELEAQASKPRVPTTFLEAMELVVATERARLELECKVGAMMPVVAAHKRLTTSEGTHEIRQAAKLLKLNPRELTEWLSENRWIYKHSRLSRWSAFQDKINEGLLMHHVNVVDLPQGGSVTSNQVRVTANGLATIAELTECDFENGDLDSDPFGLAIV